MKKTCFKNLTWNKMLKEIYGIYGPLDEQREQRLNSLASQALVGLLLYLLLSSAIFQILNYTSGIDVITIIIFNFLAFALAIIYIEIHIRKEKLRVLEVSAEEYDAVIKKYLYRAKYTGIVMFLLKLLLDPTFPWEKLNYLETLRNPVHWFNAILSGIFWWLFSRIIYKNNIRIAEEGSDN